MCICFFLFYVHFLFYIFVPDSLSSSDNDQLQEAVSEMEGMLTSLIDGVESSRANSALNSFPPDRETLLF